MSDKPSPVDDLKQGLGLIFRAAKTAVEKLPTDKLEDVARDAAKEVGRAFGSLGSELDKAFGKGASPHEPPPAPPSPAQEGAEPSEPAAPPAAEEPAPPSGPRVG